MVEYVQILADRATGPAQGFVLMPHAEEAQAAMEGLWGTPHQADRQRWDSPLL